MARLCAVALLIFCSALGAGVLLRKLRSLNAGLDHRCRAAPLLLLPAKARALLPLGQPILSWGVGELALLAAWCAAAAVYFRACVAAQVLQGDDLFNATAYGRTLPPLFGLALLPVTRTSPWCALLGGSFERAVSLHRAWGVGAAVLTGVHAGLMLYKHRPHNGLGKGGSDTTWNLHDPHSGDSWMLGTKAFTDKHSGAVIGLGVLYGSAATLCLALMVTLASYPTRRHSWRLFKASHFCFGVPFIVLASLHIYEFFYYCIPALALYAADKALSAHRARRSFDATVSGWLPGGVLRLEVAGCTRVAPLPGQFVYVHAARASLWEWHPFSVVSSQAAFAPPPSDFVASSAGAAGNPSCDERAVLHDGGLADALLVRGRGARTVFLMKGNPANGRAFAARLAAAAAENGGGLRVRLDGPFGSLAVRLERYTAVVLVAGGVGVTPFVTVTRRLAALHGQPGCALRAAWLHWSVRDAAAGDEWLPGWLDELGESSAFCGRVELWLTRRDPGPAEQPPRARAAVRLGGRMNLSATLGDALRAAAAAGKDASSVAVLACGPASLVDAAQGAAAAAGAHFHAESFEL
jgi:hypothetical protein